MAKTAYLCQACKAGDVEKIKTLIGEGVDINFNDGLPLLQAVIYGKIDAVKLLLEHNASVGAKANNPLEWAIFKKHNIIADLLILYGASLTNYILTIAKKKNLTEGVTLIESHKEIQHSAFTLNTWERILHFIPQDHKKEALPLHLPREIQNIIKEYVAGSLTQEQRERITHYAHDKTTLSTPKAKFLKDILYGGVNNNQIKHIQ